MQNRRTFLQKAALASAGIVGLSSFRKWVAPAEMMAFGRDAVKVTILHTNDTHSHIDPLPETHPWYPGLGGAARRSALINRIRSEEQQVLLLDAGDIFQGTPYFNKFGGKVEFEVMSQMNYDAATIGNHDFDNGLEGLNKMLPYADFPFVIANYDFKNTIFEGVFKPYKIFNKGGVKIGVFGLGIELKGLVDSRLYGETQYLDPLEKAAYYTHELKNEHNCDLIICLSHLGFQYKNKKVSDVILAKQSRNIDLIIGGHTHTLLKTPLAYRNRDGEEVLISQVGSFGVRLGRIDFYVKPGKHKTFAMGDSILIDSKLVRS